MRRSHSVPVALVRFFSESDTRAGRKPSGWRCQGLSLLHNIGDKNSGLGAARLTPRVWRLRGYLEGIASFDCAGRLTLYGKLEAAFQDIGGFDSGMRVSPDRHSRLYCGFRE